jgi:methionyl-tRNA synthetase
MAETRRTLVTSALPYANGPLHIGHLVEHVQTNVWVRFRRMTGHDVLYVCADDTHGAPITISARKQGRSEESIIGEMHGLHVKDFTGFDVNFDYYGSTHSRENREKCAEIWASLRREDFVVEREVTQLFDAEVGQFLADRFVKGTCPNCGKEDQYGDSCERCGATYSPTDLKNPVSTLSGSTPEIRSAPHLFITIEKLHVFLEEWIADKRHLNETTANYLRGHFLSQPLRDWDVSRPAPYFGFEIPDAPGHYWYVWFDAPIGYMAATQAYCDLAGKLFDDYWRSPETEIVHFIGKDIVYFHALFWPAMLKASGFTLPSRVQVHGMLTVDGEKMSKSRGTMINASTYLEHLDPSYLRYYFASKLTGKPDDIDLDLADLTAKVNSDLVGKVVNLASRTARFVVGKNLPDALPDDGGLFAVGAALHDEIVAAYEECDTARVARLVMTLADRANEYVDARQPWALAKNPEKAADLLATCAVALNAFRQIVLYLAPILPRLAEQAAELLSAPMDRLEAAKTPLTGTKVGAFTHMMARVDPKKVQAVVEASLDTEAAAPVADVATPGTGTDGDSGAALAAEPLAPECSIDDFGKVDLRVARVVTAEAVAEADKLVKLTVSLGGGSTRTIFAGIKAHYSPESLVGRLVVIVANLKPRKMRFGVSEGMVVAAGGAGEAFVLSPDTGAVPGQRIH